MHPTLNIGEITIRQDEAGRYCLNDLHKAAVSNGANERTKEPGKFFSSPQTIDLLGELTDTQDLGIAPVNAIKGGNDQGTYVVKELVYAYAMWINASFHLKVIRAYDAMVTGGGVMNPATLTRLQLIEIAMQAEQERLLLVDQVETLTPKAEALDRIATRTDGTLCITNAAKSLQIQPKALFSHLQAHQWIYRRAGGSGWVAYQHRLQCDLLEHKVTTIERSDGSAKTVEQVLVTAKGLAKLAEQFHLAAA
jgi:phage antirepressor YoqD-like protein